jgi:hypothetical protein
MRRLIGFFGRASNTEIARRKAMQEERFEPNDVYDPPAEGEYWAESYWAESYWAEGYWA